MKVKQGMIMTKLGDDHIVVSVTEETKCMLRLNETAAFIWHGLEEGRDEAQIAESLTREFNGVDQETALRSVRKTVADLQAKGFLVEE